MAILKDLIVTGQSRFIGDVYGVVFHGDLDGNAATATSATTATTATNLSAAPSLAASGNNITVTAGGKTSSAFTVPYATSSGSATSATKSGVATLWLYPENNNEINFGGTNAGTTIYFGYRAKDSRSIPAAFVFGGSTGSASVKASSFIKKDGTSAQFLKADGSVDSNTYATQTWVNNKGYTTNAGTVTSVGAGTGLSISGTASVNPTVNVASGYKLPTTSEWRSAARRSTYSIAAESGLIIYNLGLDTCIIHAQNYHTDSDVCTYLLEFTYDDGTRSSRVTALSPSTITGVRFYDEAGGILIWSDNELNVCVSALTEGVVVDVDENILEAYDEPVDGELLVVNQYIKESDFDNGVRVLESKTFGPYTCAAANVEKGYIFFMNVVPTSTNWYEPWHITYRLKIKTGTAACQGFYEITVGSAGTTSHYHVFNKFYSTSYYPSYYHLMAWYNSAAKYNNRQTNPIKIGERIYSAYNTTTVARTYEIEVIDIHNCVVSFPDDIETYDSVYADAKYGYCSTFNATTNGTLDNYDANSPPYYVYEYYVYYKIHSASTPLYRYKFCGFDDAGRLVPIDTTNQTSGTVVAKTPTTVPMKVKKGLVYYNTSTNITSDTTVTPTGTIYKFSSTVNNPWTYNFSSLPGQGKDIYLVGSYNRAKDEFTLDTSSSTSFYLYATQGATPTTDLNFVPGKYYWHVGCSGDNSSYPNYGKFDLDNPLYFFNGRQLIPVTPGDNGPLVISPGYTTWMELIEAKKTGRPILYYYYPGVSMDDTAFGVFTCNYFYIEYYGGIDDFYAELTFTEEESINGSSIRKKQFNLVCSYDKLVTDLFPTIDDSVIELCSEVADNAMIDALFVGGGYGSGSGSGSGMSESGDGGASGSISLDDGNFQGGVDGSWYADGTLKEIYINPSRFSVDAGGATYSILGIVEYTESSAEWGAVLRLVISDGTDFDLILRADNPEDSWGNYSADPI